MAPGLNAVKESAKANYIQVELRRKLLHGLNL